MLEQGKLLFAGERKVCDQIFEGFESLKDQCFAEVTAESVAVLLSFGDAIAKSKRSPEKLFVLLDMYEIMRELHSEVWITNFNEITFRLAFHSAFCFARYSSFLAVLWHLCPQNILYLHQTQLFMVVWW